MCFLPSVCAIFGEMSIYVFCPFKKNVIYLFWLCWVFTAARALSVCGQRGLLPSCGALASRCSGHSGCGVQAVGAQASVVAVHGLSHCCSQALEHRCGAQA